MPSLPRVITVDPTGTIARIVRAATDLLDRPIVLTDIPSGPEALEVVTRSGCNLLITAIELYDDRMKGFELALRTKQSAPDTAVVILADVDDPDDLDEETAANSPFVYMHRPVDIQQFLRVLLAGLDGGDVLSAMTAAPAPGPAVVLDMGSVPTFDLNSAQSLLEGLVRDLGAMAIYLASRTGEVLLEVGAPGYLNREQLTHALLPAVTSNIEVREVVGGQAAALQFYDGENYDVYVLTVGLHHFMCIAFGGQDGARQLGAVSRYGRRTAEDLIALLGANAWLIERAVSVKEESRPARKSKEKRATEEQEVIQLERALGFFETPAAEPEPEPALQLEPIADLDLDKLFSQSIELNPEDDPFDLDKLEQIANQQRKTGAIDFDQAQQLGIIPSQ